MSIDHSGHSPPNDTGGRSPRSAASPRVLLPVEEPSRSPGLTTLAHALAEEEGGGLLRAQIVSVPEQTPHRPLDPLVEPHRETLEESLRAVTETRTGTPVEGVVRIGHGRTRIIANTADDYDATTIVTGRRDRPSSLSWLRRSDAERLQANTSCRVVVAGNTERLTDISSILVPIAGGPHSGEAVDVARALAKYHDAWVELLHIVEPEPAVDQREKATQYFDAGIERLGDYEKYDTWLLEAGDVADAIIEQSAYYNATVLGAPRKGRLRRYVFGSTVPEDTDEARRGLSI